MQHHFWSPCHCNRKARNVLSRQNYIDIVAPLARNQSSYQITYYLSNGLPSGHFLCFIKVVMSGIGCYIKNFLSRASYIVSAPTSFHMPDANFVAVWQAIWLKFFTTSTFTPSAVLSALTLFKFPTLTSGVLDCPPSVVFGHTLLAIWRAQWSLAFDSVPFLPSRVITASYTLIQKSFDEHLVQHGMSHVPLPNIQF
ncbi:hypothetical protein G6F33_012707 [Rhizopus arrhizus]|nr:hypothetical protein G6F33_012707 [Rhizopus arrhizus]